MNPPYYEVFDRKYMCKRINGILFPAPIRTVRCPPSQPPPPQQPPSSERDDQSRAHEISRKRRDLSSSTVIENKEISLKLFQCRRTFEYILRMQEVGSDKMSLYVLEPYELSSGNRRVKARETKDQNWMLFPVNTHQDIFQGITTEGKFNLSLNQRIEGKWRIEIRRRNKCSKVESFYFHEKVNKMMRSFCEVATFIVYNTIY